MENSGSDGNTRPPDLPLEKSACVRKQQLELDMEEQTGSKLGKIISRLYIVNCISTLLI